MTRVESLKFLHKNTNPFLVSNFSKAEMELKRKQEEEERKKRKAEEKVIQV